MGAALRREQRMAEWRGACRVIQRWWRGIVVLEEERYLRTQAATLLQRWWVAVCRPAVRRSRKMALLESLQFLPCVASQATDKYVFTKALLQSLHVHPDM